MLTPTDLLRLVLDPVRVAVLGAAAVGPVDPEALAETLEVDEGLMTRADGFYWRSGGRYPTAD